MLHTCSILRTTTKNPSELTTEPTEIAIEKGGEGVFECESNGIPDSVNWFKNGEIITDVSGVRYSTEKSGFLSINGLRVSIFRVFSDTIFDFEIFDLYAVSSMSVHV